MGVILDYGSEPFLCPGETRTVKLTVWDTNKFTTPGQWINIKIHADQGVVRRREITISAPLLSTYQTRTVFEIPVVLKVFMVRR